MQELIGVEVASFREGVEDRGTRRFPNGQGPNQGRRSRLTRIPGELSTRRVQIRMTPREYRDLEQVAAENLVSPSEVIRNAVNEFVADFRERRLFIRTRGEARAKTKKGRATVCDG
jgi:hypothetical protein